MKGQDEVIVDYKNVRNGAYGVERKFCSELCAPESYNSDMENAKSYHIKKPYLKKSEFSHIKSAEIGDRLKGLLKVRHKLAGSQNTIINRQRLDSYTEEINRIIEINPELRSIIEQMEIESNLNKTLTQI